jgi:hypothetical protein
MQLSTVKIEIKRPAALYRCSPVDAEEQAALTAAGGRSSSNARKHGFYVGALCHAVLWPCLVKQHHRGESGTPAGALAIWTTTSKWVDSHLNVRRQHLWCGSELEIHHIVCCKVLNHLRQHGVARGMWLRSQDVSNRRGLHALPHARPLAGVLALQPHLL